MPTKRECVEDLLAQVEEAFYMNLKARESFENYFGGCVRISYSTRKPKLNVSIQEQKRPGPRLGSRFKIDPGKKAARRFQKIEQDIQDIEEGL